MIYYIALTVMTFVAALASIFLKKASGSENIIGMLKNINLYIGGILYVMAALVNIIILRYLDYSIVLPLTSITYIWTMVLSYITLKEKISVKKITGVGLIVIGALILAHRW